MTNEPARSLKAVLLPSVIAPRALVKRPVRRVAGMGQLRASLTRPKKWGKGVALSRARAQNVRPTCIVYESVLEYVKSGFFARKVRTVRNVPIIHGVRDRKMMKSNPKVAPLLPVA